MVFSMLVYIMVVMVLLRKVMGIGWLDLALWAWKSSHAWTSPQSGDAQAGG
jgi:hypothetical protein